MAAHCSAKKGAAMLGVFFLSGLSLLFAGYICHVAAAIKHLVMTAEACYLIDGAFLPIFCPDPVWQDVELTQLPPSGTNSN